MSASIIDPVELTQSLISCPSVTPTDAGVLQLLQNRLEKIGFTTENLMSTRVTRK